MYTKRWLPWGLSILLTIISVTAVSAAGTIGPFATTNANTSWQSQTWRNNSDSTWAKVYAKSCRDEKANGTNDWMTVKVWRNAGLFPPEDQGAKTLYCYGSSFVYQKWGSGAPNMEGPENFWFKLTDYSGGTGGGNAMDFTYKVEWN
jgi:hypothetical protein